MDLTVERLPGSIFGWPILATGSILDPQLHFNWPRIMSILQVTIKRHHSLELGLYSRPVSVELGFSLYDALETMNSLGSDVTLTCRVVICLLLNLLVTAFAKLARLAVLSDGQPGVLFLMLSTL